VNDLKRKKGGGLDLEIEILVFTNLSGVESQDKHTPNTVVIDSEAARAAKSQVT